MYWVAIKNGQPSKKLLTTEQAAKACKKKDVYAAPVHIGLPQVVTSYASKKGKHE